MIVSVLSIASAAFSPLSAATLTGQTSKPNLNMFIPNDLIPIEFTVSGITPGSAEATLRIKVVDEHDKQIAAKDIAVSSVGSTWTTSYLAPSTRMGFYRVFASLSTGETLPAMGSRKAGYLTYAVVTDPGKRTAYPPEEARFGMQGGFNGSINTIAYIGINWVNGPGAWSGNEPDYAGQYAESRAAKKAAGETGPSKMPGATRGYEWTAVTRDGKQVAWPVYPVFSLHSPPAWAFIPGKKVGSTAPLKPEAYGPWGDYCKAFAQSVVEDYPNLTTHFYQVTWEPNWFNGTNEQFYAIYQIAADAIHATDPKAIVAGPTKSGVGDFGMQVEAELFKMGLGNKLDGYTIHPYTKMPAENNNYLDKIRLLMAFPTKRAGHTIPVYATEQGAQTNEDPAKEIWQARELVRASLITLGEGARFAFGFFIHDYPGEPGYGHFYNLRDDKKFGTERVSPKPVVPVYAAETMLIDGHETVGPLDYLGDTALGYAFQRGDDVVLALWDYSPKPRTVTLGTGAKTVDVYDWMGNKQSVATSNGSITLTLTQEPVYVRGVSPSVWGKGSARSLDLVSSSITTMPGGAAVISGSLRGGAGKPISRLSVSANAALGTSAKSESESVAAGAAKPFSVSLPVPAKTAFGTYLVDVAIQSGSTNVAMRRVRIDVKPPVKVAAITPAVIETAANGQLQLKTIKVSLSSTQGQTVSGKFSLSVAGVKGASGKADFTVEANSDPVIDLSCSGLSLTSGQTYAATLTGTTTGGYQFNEPLTLALASAPKAAKEPVVDGNIGDWASSTALPLTDSAHQTAGTIRFSWVPSGLAFAAEVTGTAASAADTIANLQIATNIDPQKVERSTGDVFNDMLAQRRFQIITFSMVKDAPQAKRTFSYNFDRLHGGVIPGWDLPLKIVKADGKTTYEGVIPWKHLASPAPLPAGSVIGLGAALNVAIPDEPSYGVAGGSPGGKPITAAATLFGGISPLTDSNKLGCLLLAP
jgi:hypothetical protein